jgi:alpha-D-ribose 1-methylphosphonate 5-triphosphate synthase subunit PhnL
MSEPLLSIRGLKKTYVQHLHGGRRMAVLRGVDLELEAGTCTVVRGPSGSGKTSLLRCIYRSALCDEGSIALRGAAGSVDMAAASDREVLRARAALVGMATQFLSVVPRVSALDLVIGKGLAHDDAVNLLERLGLPRELHGIAPATFSGGQRQMLNLALALAQPRPLLLLDEVTASLDHERRRRAFRALLERKHAGTALLAVFHDVPDEQGLVDRVVVMEEGKVRS